MPRKKHSNENVAATESAAQNVPATNGAAPSTAGPTAELKDGLQTPESVLYDAEQDVYFISNINGQPLAADNNGYISRLNPDTMQGEMKFIEAGKNNVTLNAPKGMAVMGDTLYVADLNTVRKFDRKTGAPKGEVKIPGATFLNDLATDGKVVYASDSGLKAGAGGNFEPTGTDAIWQISGDKATKIASGTDLNRPNGLEVVNGQVWAVTFGAKELYRIEKGKKTNIVQLKAGKPRWPRPCRRRHVPRLELGLQQRVPRTSGRTLQRSGQGCEVAGGHRLRHQAASPARPAFHGEPGHDPLVAIDESPRVPRHHHRPVRLG